VSSGVGGRKPKTVKISLTVDLIGLDVMASSLDDFLAALRAMPEPLTTKEIAEWLLTKPDPTFTQNRHLAYLALLCATAIQRL